MKNKWSPFQSFNVKTSAVFSPFRVRAKDRPEASVVFNAFGQILDADTHSLIDWTPEEQSEATVEKADAAQVEICEEAV